PRIIRSTGVELLLTRFGPPVDRPGNPLGGCRLFAERRLTPARPAVGAYLDVNDPAPTRPRPSAELDPTGLDHPGPREELGEPGWDHQSAGEDTGHVHAFIVRVITTPVRNHPPHVKP